MWRSVLCALSILTAANNAFAQNEGLVAQGWSVGSAETIAASHPTNWTFLPQHNAVQSNLTGLTCPQGLSSATLTAAKDNSVIAECWYQTGEREGVWATSSDSPDFARRTVMESYATIPTDPDIELAPLETTAIGACTLEVRRMRNVHGFWVTVRDLYTPDAFHQFRTITYNDTRRSLMEDLAQELLDISLSARCAGVS